MLYRCRSTTRSVYPLFQNHSTTSSSMTRSFSLSPDHWGPRSGSTTLPWSTSSTNHPIRYPSAPVPVPDPRRRWTNPHRRWTWFPELPPAGGLTSAGFPELPPAGGLTSAGFPELPPAGGLTSARFPELPPASHGLFSPHRSSGCVPVVVQRDPVLVPCLVADVLVLSRKTGVPPREGLGSTAQRSSDCWERKTGPPPPVRSHDHRPSRFEEEAVDSLVASGQSSSVSREKAFPGGRMRMNKISWGNIISSIAGSLVLV